MGRGHGIQLPKRVCLQKRKNLRPLSTNSRFESPAGLIPWSSCAEISSLPGNGIFYQQFLSREVAQSAGRNKHPEAHHNLHTANTSRTFQYHAVPHEPATSGPRPARRLARYHGSDFLHQRLTAKPEKANSMCRMGSLPAVCNMGSGGNSKCTVNLLAQALLLNYANQRPLTETPAFLPTSRTFAIPQSSHSPLPMSRPSQEEWSSREGYGVEEDNAG